MSRRVKVHTYSGYKADEYPKWFEHQGKSLYVREIKSRWLEPDSRVFKVLADDGHTYILRDRFQEHADWELEIVK